MTDERSQPPDLIATGIAGLIDGVRRDTLGAIDALRDDVREDNRELEGRVSAQIGALSDRQADTHKLVVEFTKGHSQEHEDEATERRKTHGEFYDFIRAAELDKARRDGALGVLRFMFELTSKHAGRIVQVLLATAALLGIASGSITIGAR
jgi:hypothetical protein